jgi:hypothetical protein
MPTYMENNEEITVSQSVFDKLFPRQPELPPQPYTIYKTDVVSRMTDTELEQFDAALTAAPLRQRRMWTDCQALESSSEYFGGLTTQFTAAFGADRAKVILAPSEG